jgi:hypothetical protein
MLNQRHLPNLYVFLQSSRMVQVTYEQLQHELSLLFNYNPPPLVAASNSASLCPKLVPPPSIFYDKHLDERLTLQRIVLLPSITTRLSDAVEKISHSLEHRKIRLPLYDTSDTFPTERFRAYRIFRKPIIDANSVAKAYQQTTARYCMDIASMMLLSPAASSWDTILNWIQTTMSELSDHPALEENYALNVMYMPGESSNESVSISTSIWESIDSETRERLPQIAQRFPVLAVWQIFTISPESEALLNDMGRIALSDRFLHEKCLTTGHVAVLPPNLSYAPDATSTLWDVPLSSDCEIHKDASIAPSALVKDTTLPSAQFKGNSDSKVLQTKKSPRIRRLYTPRGTNTNSKSGEHWPSVTIPSQKSSTEHSTRSFLQRVRFPPPFI